jgi:hypothetical protein
MTSGDVFVAVDKWKNARLEHPEETTEYVAAVALPDAASAMFLTTLTTAVLIIFDYVMNVLLVFPALCIYDKVLMSRGGHEKVNWCITCTCCGYLVPSGYDDEDEEAQNADAPTKQNVDDIEGEEFKPSLIQRILLSFYHGLHYIRWPVFVASMVAFALTIYFASTLELPTSSDVRLLDDSSQFEQSYVWRQQLLSKALEKAGGSQASVIWGVKPADTGDQSKFFSKRLCWNQSIDVQD